MLVVTVNAETGELATFDRNSGVELADAATAAVSLPGAGPTHVTKGTRYISGGVRSVDNADLAAEYAKVVALSPFGERKGPLPPGQFEACADLQGPTSPARSGPCARRAAGSR